MHRGRPPGSAGKAYRHRNRTRNSRRAWASTWPRSQRSRRTRYRRRSAWSRSPSARSWGRSGWTPGRLRGSSHGRQPGHGPRFYYGFPRQGQRHQHRGGAASNQNAGGDGRAQAASRRHIRRRRQCRSQPAARRTPPTSVSQFLAPAIRAAPANDRPATDRARGRTQQAAQANTEASPPTAAEALTATSGMRGRFWSVTMEFLSDPVHATTRSHCGIKSVRRQILTIGRLACGAGMNLETVRYCERIGLMPAPVRTEGGHRSYAPEHAQRRSPAAASFWRNGLCQHGLAKPEVGKRLWRMAARFAKRAARKRSLEIKIPPS